MEAFANPQSDEQKEMVRCRDVEIGQLPLPQVLRISKEYHIAFGRAVKEQPVQLSREVKLREALAKPPISSGN